MHVTTSAAGLLYGIKKIMCVKLSTQSVSCKYLTVVRSHPLSSTAIPKNITVFLHLTINAAPYFSASIITSFSPNFL